MSFDKNKPVFLNTKELSRRWHMQPNTLEHWRSLGLGPTPFFIGRRILYLIENVIEFEEKSKIKDFGKGKQ